MNKSCTYLFPVFAILLAFACLSAERAVAQDYCLKCESASGNDEDESDGPYECDSKDNPKGYLACTLSRGGKQCATSTAPDGGWDCHVALAMDGRVSPDVESKPWLQAVGGTELPGRVQQTVASVDVPPKVARHGCTGAIIQRRYSPARIAELRSGLRRVTI